MKTGRPRKPKHCPSCGTTELTAFDANKARWDNLQVHCRECVRTKRFIKTISTSDSFVD